VNSLSFYKVIDKYRDFDFSDYFDKVSDSDILRSLDKDKLDNLDLLNLLSPRARKHLEPMAQKANKLAMQYMGKTVCLYTPMYIANYCVNECVYCGYNIKSGIKRKKLNMEEIEREGKSISQEGFKHILVLTGESEYHSSIEYIGDAVALLSKKFPSIGIEVYPMEVDGYKHLVYKGADSLTVYQETYNEDVYKEVHLNGPKADFKFRLDAPERGAIAGMRSLSVGALLGLSEFRKDAFFTILHGEYLKTNYPHLELAYSAPRIKPFKGSFEGIVEVSDVDLYQVMTCMRLFDPHSALNVSTRENLEFRKHLMPLGVTKLSASVTTDVGGHSQDEHDTAQFEIEEDCTISDVDNMLKSIGYQYVFKDWERF
jgi:2-iminoacetate synthase